MDDNTLVEVEAFSARINAPIERGRYSFVVLQLV